MHHLYGVAVLKLASSFVVLLIPLCWVVVVGQSASLKAVSLNLCVEYFVGLRATGCVVPLLLLLLHGVCDLWVLTAVSRVL